MQRDNLTPRYNYFGHFSRTTAMTFYRPSSANVFMPSCKPTFTRGGEGDGDLTRVSKRGHSGKIDEDTSSEQRLRCTFVALPHQMLSTANICKPSCRPTWRGAREVVGVRECSTTGQTCRS